MIRPLRQRHRRMVYTLGVLLPVAFAAGLGARKPVPTILNVPSERIGQATDFGQVVWTKADLWPSQRITTSLRRNAAGSLALELIFRDLTKPDVLVYWAAGKDTNRERLPENARLLGALLHRAPRPIPAEARGTAGRLVLYSLADQEIVAVSRPFIIPQP